MFGIYYHTAKKHIRAIEKQRSTKRSVVKSGVADKDYSGSYTCEDSKIYPDYYGLEMVIAVAFRVQSANAEVFRKWLTRKLTKMEIPEILVKAVKNPTLN